MTQTVVSSASREVVIGFDRPFVMIGERINPTGRKLLAAEMAPRVAERVIAAHRSVEPGHAIVLERLGLRPLLDLDMRQLAGHAAAQRREQRLCDVALDPYKVFGLRAGKYIAVPGDALASEAMRMLELFELQAQEGPCLDCYRDREPVNVPDLESERARWPAR